MFEKYTERARRVIFSARYEALRHGASRIETPCLLLAILNESQGLVTRLLPGGAEELARLRAEVEALISQAAGTLAPNADLPLNHPAKRVLAYAAEESERLQDDIIDNGHLLLGVLREKGPETACLKAHGIDLEKVREELDWVDPETGPGEPE
jgi:ATP-dependent Clp protease ATP-binding subunit ClpC